MKDDLNTFFIENDNPSKFQSDLKQEFLFLENEGYHLQKSEKVEKTSNRGVEYIHVFGEDE